MKLNRGSLTVLATVTGLLLPSFAFAMSDGEIASIMQTANDAEIAAAKTAQTKSDNKEVKKFAKHMIDDHSKNEADGTKIEKKDSIAAQPSDASTALKQDADKKMDDLNKLSGPDFDKAYIASQVQMHQDLLTKLTTDLIPAAQNADLKKYLETTKKHVEMHLAMAQKIQTSLTK